METLIVYAHPKEKGHNSETLKEVVKQLNTQGKQFEIIDLYKIKYDPVLHENELYSAGRTVISKQNKEFQKKIDLATNIIFIYPIWWYNAPAILKGFLDRVFTDGFAFHFNKNHLPIGHLKGKKVVQLTTTGGPRFLYTVLGGNKGIKTVKQSLSLCGIKSKYFILGGCTGTFKEEKRPLLEKNVNKAMKFLF
jgi:NAD(P)H dehydrogenase (quinone)